MLEFFQWLFENPSRYLGFGLLLFIVLMFIDNMVSNIAKAIASRRTSDKDEEEEEGKE